MLILYWVKVFKTMNVLIPPVLPLALPFLQHSPIVVFSSFHSRTPYIIRSSDVTPRVYHTKAPDASHLTRNRSGRCTSPAPYA